ncbi:hypothetical protein, partial [Enterobacter intestinihominis]
MIISVVTMMPPSRGVRTPAPVEIKTASVTQSNESAEEANDQASKASAAAARGGEVVSQAISTM